MRKATLCFLVRDSQICLGFKKRGFGVDRWNGFGGKVLEDESVEAATIREAKEEAGVSIDGLKKVAELNFFFPHRPDWDQVVHAYFAHDWQGEPAEGEEMRPQWFPQESLPFDQMWPDDRHWLPRVLGGEKLKAEFRFGENDQLLDFKITAVPDF